MKTRYLSIDYLPFRKYHNGSFKLHLAIILSIFIITRFFVLMVIPNTTENKEELSLEHNVEKILKLLSNYTNTNKKKFTSEYELAMNKSISAKEKQPIHKKENEESEKLFSTNKYKQQQKGETKENWLDNQFLLILEECSRHKVYYIENKALQNKTIFNNQEDWIHYRHWEDKEILMNIETGQATRSKRITCWTWTEPHSALTPIMFW